MGFTHYPKTEDNLIFAWVWPAIPKGKSFANLRPFHEVNRLSSAAGLQLPLEGYHSAQPFTRFYGSVYADQPLVITFAFSNEEADQNGDFIADDTISALHYDAVAAVHTYRPDKQTESGKFLVTIYGRWIKVAVRVTEPAPQPKELRVFVRGSVF